MLTGVGARDPVAVGPSEGRDVAERGADDDRLPLAVVRLRPRAPCPAARLAPDASGVAPARSVPSAARAGSRGRSHRAASARLTDAAERDPREVLVEHEPARARRRARSSCPASARRAARRARARCAATVGPLRARHHDVAHAHGREHPPEPVGEPVTRELDRAIDDVVGVVLAARATAPSRHPGRCA